MAGPEQVTLVQDEIMHETTPLDAKTILVDGIKGIAASGSLVRLSFTENVLDTSAEFGSPGSIKGRHVINLAMDKASFLAILDLLNQVKSDLAGASGE